MIYLSLPPSYLNQLICMQFGEIILTGHGYTFLCVIGRRESSSTCSSESLIQFYFFDLNILDSRQFTVRAHLCKTNYPTDQHVARDFIPFSVSHPFMHLYSCVPHPLRFVSTVICNLLALTMAATRRLQKVKVS